jgi:hypothetical protein
VQDRHCHDNLQIAPMSSLEENKAMNGIQYATDERGRNVDVPGQMAINEEILAIIHALVGPPN